MGLKPSIWLGTDVKDITDNENQPAQALSWLHKCLYHDSTQFCIFFSLGESGELICSL